MIRATVMKSTGSWYDVLDDTGITWKARLIGKIRLDDLQLTNPIGVGDHVLLQPEQEGEATIRSIAPRRNYIVRQSPRQKHQLHLLAANVDQAMLITTIVSPSLKVGFVDRFLLMTEPYDIPCIMVFNKADIYDDEAMDMYRQICDIYQPIGYTVLLTSAEKLEGVEELKKILHGKTTMIAGQSGVGKSSLVNAIQPGMGLRTEEISDYSGKGQHTTTFAEMFVMEDASRIIDTPGIKTLAFNHLEVMEVAHNFREFFSVTDQCRFGGSCSHRNEPKCAVKSGVDNGLIHPLRYQNYLQIVDEIEHQNYWEINRDF
jgi:ribosome biogenesis GTPase / thiamine phosphate phosphatase